MDRVLVAGGAGFLGSNLCRMLLARGAHVTCVDDLCTGRAVNITDLAADDRFAFVLTDVTRAGFDVAGDFDLVCNFASPASPLAYAAMPLETLRVGSIGTEHLIEIARRSGARFLHASTSEVYGDPDVHPQPETYWGRVNPNGPRSMYDESKRYAEALCAAYERSYGLELRTVRIFNTYGPRMRIDDGRVVTNFIAQALRGEPLTIYGDGTQTRSFCFVDDLLDGILRLAASDVRGPVNIGNPGEFTMLELAELVCEIVGEHPGIEFRPRPGDDPLQRRPDITRARTLLGWEPAVVLRDGLTRTIEWFRADLSR